MSTSTPTTRWAMVDDRDSRVNYQGRWSPSPESVVSDSRGYSGETFNRTLTQSEADGATITFDFEGYAVGFYGSVESTLTTRMPRYTCMVDGIEMPTESHNDDPFITNHYSFCDQVFLPDGKHTATFRIDDVDSTDNPILFDYVIYWPSPGADLYDTTEKVSWNDTKVTFSSGWSALPGSNGYPRSSFQTSSRVKLDFEGDSVTMFGVIPNGTYDSSTSSYTLDDGDPVSFTVPRSRSRIRSHWNYPYFSLTGLSEDKHTLVVTDGSNQRLESPLTMLSFQFRGNPSGNDSSSSSINRYSSSGLSVGAKAGIAVGVIAIAAILAAVLAFFFIRRRRQQRTQKENIGQSITLPTTSPAEFSPKTPYSAAPLLGSDRPMSMASVPPNSMPANLPRPISVPIPMVDSEPTTPSSPNGGFGNLHHTVAASPHNSNIPMVAAGNPDVQYLAANAYHPASGPSHYHQPN